MKPSPTGFASIQPTADAGFCPTRRHVLTAGAACAVTLAGPFIARAATARSLKIGYLYSKNSQFGAGAVAFAEEVGKRTDGRYTIEHFPDGSLGGDLEMLAALSKGEVDLGFIASTTVVTLIADYGIFDIPFLFRDAAHAHAVLDSPIGQEYLAMLQPKSLVGLAWGENGMRHLTNSRRPVRAPDDIKGLRLRVPQSPIMVKGFQALGALPEQLAFPAVYGALESGRFDGQENPIATIEAAKFDRVQKYLSLTGHIYSTAIVFMSQDAWEDLTASDKVAFTEAARVGGRVSRVFAGRAEQEGVTRLAAKGMQVISQVDRAAFAEVLAPAQKDFEQMFGADKIARIKSFRTA